MNSPEQREKELFEAAQKLPPKDRAAYLDRACGDDAQLHQRIISALFQAQEETQTTPAHHEPTALQATAPSAPPDPPREKPGDHIGRYKLLELIAEGGMGRVWVAEQIEPLRRQVALKVIKIGMDTRQVIARFEAERQALALMDHPNIAKVLDAGATATGRPYFVMELVQGIPITTYCDQHTLPTRDRLELFRQVCKAVHHAHLKGIIHRDLKPSNILVALHDGQPAAKIIDFGIAKATAGQHLTDKTLHTVLAEFIGTPAYMSPEQAEMTRISLDTRSDIYSLGVLLYELLTGTTPFDAHQLLQAGLDGIRRIIREQDPPRPSTRFSLLDAKKQTTIAKHRHTEPPQLIRFMRGDLDWIILKTLEKDRTKRYETANALADEVSHFLKSEPIIARPPSSVYRLQKFARRHAATLAAGSAISLLALALVFTVLHRTRTPLPPQFGELEIQTEPGGVEVWLRGQRVGVTPFKAAKLTPGEYYCLLQSSNYAPSETTIQIVPGRQCQLLAYLKESKPLPSGTRPDASVDTFIATVPPNSRSTILTVKGNVESQARGTTNWVTAYPGLVLQPGDRVRTWPNSQAAVRLFDSIMRVRESSLFQLEPTYADVLQGSFIFYQKGGPTTNGLQIRTPSAIARIGG